jgi:hypothetical protein
MGVIVRCGFSIAAVATLACAASTPISTCINASSDGRSRGLPAQEDVVVDSRPWSNYGRIIRAQYPQMVRCFTPQGMCWLPGSAPPGTPCWCATPYGPVAGRTG